MRANRIIIMLSAAVFLLLAQETPYSYENQLDLNNASLEQIRKLPVSEKQAEALYEWVTYKGPFNDIYEILKVDGMDRETWKRLKPLVWLEPYEKKTARDQRIESILYQISRLEGAEGFNQSLMDMWLEKALNPIDINTANYEDLLNMQNITAVDAAAIFRYRNNGGVIHSARNLRSIPGLSYYGYRNLRTFVRYEEDTRSPFEFHGHVMLRQDNTPFYGAEDESGANQIFTLNLSDQNTPRLYWKGRFSMGPHFQFGLSYLRNVGEDDAFIGESYNGSDLATRGKFYVGAENYKFGAFNLYKLYLGTYHLGFGQGVVMETGDEFTPRKNGRGFRKRLLGITPDASINRQWYMRGVAAEFGLDWLVFTGFFSKNKRDAILNQIPVTIDGKEYHAINQFVVLNQRIPSLAGQRYQLDSLNGNWVQSVEEVTYGGHLDFFIPGLPASKIGATYYESLYDKPLQPDIYDIVADNNESRINPLDDAEILNAYGGPISWGTSPLWDKAISFRRVYGIDFSTVFKNIEINGEYAELDKNRGFGSNPSAMVLGFFTQWNNLNFSALYRDYDLEFDNPYQRSFSNYQRYKGSIYEDYFYLDSPAFGQLYTNAYQPQAERGLYLTTRYQMTRTLLLMLEFDNFERKSDGTEYYRLVANIRYSPIFPLRFYIRYKNQAHEYGNDVTPNKFYQSSEFRIRASFLLSNYNELGLFYSTSSLALNPRPRLSYPADPGDSRYDKVEGQAGMPAYAIGTYTTYNFSKDFRFKGGLMYYEGFLWNFEDTQFVVMDNLLGSFRWWGSFYMRLNEHLSFRLKYTVDRSVPVLDQHARDTSNNPAATEEGYPSDVTNNIVTYSRDYSHIYFFELNYYF